MGSPFLKGISLSMMYGLVLLNPVIITSVICINLLNESMGSIITVTGEGGAFSIDCEKAIWADTIKTNMTKNILLILCITGNAEIFIVNVLSKEEIIAGTV